MQIEVGTVIELATSSEWKTAHFLADLDGGPYIPVQCPTKPREKEPDLICGAGIRAKWSMFTKSLGIEDGRTIAVADILAMAPDGEGVTTDREDIGPEFAIQFAQRMRKHHRKGMGIQNGIAIGKVDHEREPTVLITWRTALITMSPMLLAMMADPHALEGIFAEYPGVYKPRSLGALHFPKLVTATHSLAQEEKDVWMKFRTVQDEWTASKSGITPGMIEMMEIYLCGFPYIADKQFVGLVEAHPNPAQRYLLTHHANLVT